MAGELQLVLFGGLQVVRDGVSVSGFVSNKAQALLCYLAVTRRPHFRSVLATLLWNEMPEADARMNLRHVLANLRKLVGSHLIITRDTIAFNPHSPYWLDVERFEAILHGPATLNNIEQLKEAAAWYRGDFLAGFYVRATPDFDQWMAAQRERLRHLALYALHQLAVHNITHNDYPAAVDYLTRLLQLDPWREEAHRQLMLLLAQSGQRDAALAQYRACVRILAEELGVEPEDETIALFKDIQAGMVGLRLSAATAPHPLPVPLTPLLQRTAELAQIHALLEDSSCRLVTLVGPAGVGKTRLALEVVITLHNAFHGEVFFVSLASINDPGVVIASIAHALDVRESAEYLLFERLRVRLHGRRRLIFLDNFEHLLPAAPLVAKLLEVCPQLTVLVTSRSPLHVRNEQEFELLPLAVPPLGHRQTTEDLVRYGAVAFFVQRARAANRAFEIVDANAMAVAEICRRLDGLPLAIELAAPRVKFMSPQMLLTRLEHRLALLTDGPRDMPARHQTLQSAIAWSYDLLEPGIQMLFARLAVFVGGWALEVAEAVCAVELLLGMDVLESMVRLVNTSLVQRAEQPNGDVRFRMLETIREYTLERLRSTGDEAIIRRRHAEYYLQLAEAAKLELPGSNQKAWLDQLEVEHDNLRAALEWLLEQGFGELALRFANALQPFWYIRGYLTEGRRWLEAALGAVSMEPSRVRAQALSGTGALARYQGDFQSAEIFHAASLVIFREQADQAGIASELNNLANIAWELGKHKQASDLWEESLCLYRQLGNLRGAGIVLGNLGELAQACGDYERAKALYSDGLTLRREVGDIRGTAVALANLGSVNYEQGAYEQAMELFVESAEICGQLKEHRVMARCLEGLGMVVGARGLAIRAPLLWSTAEALRHTVGMPVQPTERPLLDRAMERVRAQLDEDEWIMAWEKGQRCTPAEVIAYTLGVREAT